MRRIRKITSEILTIPIPLEIIFFAMSLMVRALLSHHSQAHSSCGAPVRQAQMIQPPSLQTALFFFPSLSFPLFRALCLFWEHSNLLLLCTLSSSPLPPLLPSPLLRAGGRGAITHHLVITGTKGALVAMVAAAQCAPPLGKEWRRVPHLSQLPPVLHRPHLLG